MSETQMSLVEHLTELRKKIIIAVVSIFVGALGSYYFASDVIEFLSRPVGQELVYLSPTEAFFTELKISAFLGLLVALPIILYQVWSFILPGLKDNERKYIAILVPLSYIFFMVGVAFGNFVVLPFGIRFFLSFAGDNLMAMFSLNNYISFIIAILIPFGIVFELPLLITLLVKMRLIGSKFLRKNRRFVIVAIFLFGAILTPPDVVSQMMMAFPLILLYEASIIVARIIE